jgi:hypothetical protein
MTLHQWNRFSEHADLTQLSPPAIAIGKEIAQRLNGTRTGLMRLGVRYLARQTGYSEKTTNKAINELLDKGYLSATRAGKRSARVFTLLVACPADCKQQEKHYSPAEKKALAALENNPAPMAECGTLEPSSVELSNLECGTRVHTNKELNKEIIKNLNTRKIEPVTSPESSVLVSLSEWLNVCSNTLAKVPQDKFTEHHRELENDPNAYHLSANDFLKARLANGSIIGNYTGYLSRLIITNPHELMRTAAGNSKTLKRLSKYIAKQLTEYSTYKDLDTRELVFDKELMTAGLLAAYGSDWLDTFATQGALNRTLFEQQVNALLAANPEAYKRLENALTANSY